MQYHDLLKRGL
jgi:hypothetical protein